jgi:hypothetical protein
VFYKTQELVNLREHLVSIPVFGGVHVAHLFNFLCCVLCFVWLLPVSCVPNVAQHIAKNYSWIQMTKDGIGNYILVESGLLIP